MADVSSDSPDLVFAMDSSKVMLTLQRPLMRLIIQESFENIRVSLLFKHAFPTGRLTIRYTKEALLSTAYTYRPGSEHIFQKLLHDDDYMSKLIPLVSHAYPNDDWTEPTHSHTRGFALSEVRSKIVAVPLLCQLCWQ